METLLIGTYTRKTSKGIYRIELNTETESLENLSLVAETENPTYLEYDHDTNTLLAVYQDGEEGGVALWDYKNKTASLKESISEKGVQPCFVHFDKNRNEIVDANYHRGVVHVYKDGKVVENFTYPEGAHAHFSLTHPKTGALYTVDLGNDTVHKYIDLKEVATYEATKGAGPRHLVFHPTADYIYLFTELSNELIVLKDGETLEEVQVVSTLPEPAESAGAAIRISNDGRFVYVSNRTHDSISVFKVNDDYTVEMIQNISAYGEHPRDFNISPDENYLVVANRDTNNLVLYKRDHTTGELSLISKDTAVQEPVSLIFIKE